MSNTSASAYLVWSIFSCLLFSFFLFHLYRFDGFRCLRWNSGAYSGAFKRVMTYSILFTLPLIGTYAVGLTLIKYQEGEVFVPGFGIIPKPSQFWSEMHRNALFPLHIVFSVGWSFELVTHLEELCFWLFLVNAGSSRQDWFKSYYFRTWFIGSILSITYMPLVTILTRNDPDKSEAFTILAGSLGSLSLTLWFIPILWTFPSFLNSLRKEGVDMATIVRLTKFHELNMIRVIFRFIMTVPLVILGVDGVSSHPQINTHVFLTDFLTILAGFGTAISSGITWVIFFPRSIEGEIATREAEKERKRMLRGGYSSSSQNRSSGYTLSFDGSRMGGSQYLDQPTLSVNGTQIVVTTPLSHASHDHTAVSANFRNSMTKNWEDEDPASALPKLAIRPNRRVSDNEVELGGADYLTENNLSKHNISRSNTQKSLHALHNFKSPIDMSYWQPDDDTKGQPQSTFNRRW